MLNLLMKISVAHSGEFNINLFLAIKSCDLPGVLQNTKTWQERTIYHHRRAQILADPAKAMVDMIFLCFPGFGYLP